MCFIFTFSVNKIQIYIFILHLGKSGIFDYARKELSPQPPTAAALFDLWSLPQVRGCPCKPQQEAPEPTTFEKSRWASLRAGGLLIRSRRRGLLLLATHFARSAELGGKPIGSRERRRWAAGGVAQHLRRKTMNDFNDAVNSAMEGYKAELAQMLDEELLAVLDGLFLLPLVEFEDEVSGDFISGFCKGLHYADKISLEQAERLTDIIKSARMSLAMN